MSDYGPTHSGEASKPLAENFEEAHGEVIALAREIDRLRKLIDTAAETGDIYEQRLCEREAEIDRLRGLLRWARNKLSGSYSNIELLDRIDAALSTNSPEVSSKLVIGFRETGVNHE